MWFKPVGYREYKITVIEMEANSFNGLVYIDEYSIYYKQMRILGYGNWWLLKSGYRSIEDARKAIKEDQAIHNITYKKPKEKTVEYL